MSVKILIVAGGTGGHVFPALAVADKLRQRGVNILWLGTRQGMESRVVPAAGYQMRYVTISGLRGKGLLALITAPFKLVVAIVQSINIVLRFRPNCALGMGGFVTGPAGIATLLTGRPLLLHEQNAIPGLTNRLLSRLARVVMEAFPGSFPAAVGAQHTGNPVRDSISQVAEPGSRFAGRQGTLRLLVLGGSQGALHLNQVMPQALALVSTHLPLDIRHQCGKRHQAVTQQAYDSAGVQARVTPFIEDMAEAYAWADLVVCRAGAMTIAELAAVGVAAILVPFPYAVDDHQTHNAAYLVQAGAARLLPESDLTEHSLAEVLTELLSDRAGLLTMSQAARSCARPDAAATVADICLEVAA
jgi:UDP-N-acetylglucosamine--N-acetylmuramyl-(pentapeptide) pyrophosphoryl-undecaprenol N-acetylglucosamine transferase